MFDNLGWMEILVLLLIGLFIFGPERLPKAIGDGMRFLRNVRNMARNATSDLSRELGTDIELEDLHPKRFLRKHLLSEEEEESLRSPFREVYSDLDEVSKQTKIDAPPLWQEKPAAPATEPPPAQRNGGRQVIFDVDAT